jgi:hypothetical protein
MLTSNNQKEELHEIIRKNNSKSFHLKNFKIEKDVNKQLKKEIREITLIRFKHFEILEKKEYWETMKTSTKSELIILETKKKNLLNKKTTSMELMVIIFWFLFFLVILGLKIFRKLFIYQ